MSFNSGFGLYLDYLLWDKMYRVRVLLFIENNSKVLIG